MSTKNLFRSLILMQWAITALSFLLIRLEKMGGFGYQSTGTGFDSIELLAYQINTLNSSDDLFIYLYFGLFLLYIASTIGMFFFANWARYIYLIVVILFEIVSLIEGNAVVHPAIQDFFFTLSRVIDGFIIALSFYSNVSTLFTESNSNKSSAN